MRFVKTLVLLLVLMGTALPLTAADKSMRIEQKIMNKILRALSGKSHVRVYYYGSRLPDGLKNNPSVRLTQTPQEADVIVVGRRPPSRLFQGLRQPILTLDYGVLKSYPNAMGAYFWQKGRPNIVMIRSRLSRANIRLPAEFEPYIENTIW